MQNISTIKNCYGCGVCSTVCPKNIIDIKLNEDGFYEPQIRDLNKCINCGLCVNVCAFSHKDLAPMDRNVKSYAAWSDDKRVQRKCSSGGIGFEIGKQLIEQGYKACGVRYNADTQRAEHYIASTVEQFIPSIGSKYIQSYTVEGFKAVNRRTKHLVTGTPCQIDSFRRYIQKFRVEDNFVLLDFFCHSVPSMLAWKKYMELVERFTGTITYASWRNKHTGWHDSWSMGIDGEEAGEKVNWHDSYNLQIREKKNFYNSRLSKGDIFYKLFLGDYCCNPACHKECKYKYKTSSADIRIGDLWGKTYKDNEDGVSALVSYTQKGNDVIQSLKGVTLIEHPFEVVAEGQMKENAHRASFAWLAKLLLKNQAKNNIQWRILFFLERIIIILQKITKKS